MHGRRVSPDELNALMEFDHVIEVHDSGMVSEPTDVWAPELYDEEVSDGWVLMNGYSGQYGYAGPIMHPSEYIGGDLARDILAEPGVYVALIAKNLDDSEPDGWAVARRV
jgi:hypothetical protein